ncbi:hypothetical protein EMIHUDRAFT_232797 [Emiliania huxleyi CCMP1516]|uniref:Uncharacterized protein n=2 Tax=Emiliania huxleyi TaxID=2903 RepID=A0A0D3K3X9_EMIH1|nr:hypothetical protein EMIHUDRAFT_232797 [Emiliania huxleyi CCMP1516]EOD30464.1 hypothetical protein EMIHUDRAFT_232797 [Emiliania huxleyi CCMP1516]|eukprot:XP_005782893.1 hypothetical protein EMIHUDRAFT_232797 [Emiliania huxleyi CCMP1516]
MWPQQEPPAGLRRTPSGVALRAGLRPLKKCHTVSPRREVCHHKHNRFHAWAQSSAQKAAAKSRLSSSSSLNLDGSDDDEDAGQKDAPAAIKPAKGGAGGNNSSLCLVSLDGSRARVEAVFSDFVQLSAPHVSIFEMEQVQDGELGAHFFDDVDDANSVLDSDAEEEMAPLKERRGGGKMAASKKGKGAAADGRRGRRPLRAVLTGGPCSF